jgi:ParB-like chromosome segregation protein Spo0J/DNA-binding XRE family transcriptional regulator
MVDPKSLKPSGYNPNVLNDDQRAQLVAEVKWLGKLLKPAVCREDDGQLVIIDGEHNWRAALEAGLSEIPVEILELQAEDETRTNFADFEARRQTFVRNLSGTWHKVRLGRMFVEMLNTLRVSSNRELAQFLGISEGTVRNMILYNTAARMCAGRENCPDEDAIAAMGVRQVRELIARLEGLADDGEQQDQPGAAEPEARILARLKRAWHKATEDERNEFLTWTGITETIDTFKKLVEAYRRELAKAQTPAAEPVASKPVATANGEARNDYAARGARIKAAREERGLSQRELGDLAGVNKVQVSPAERGLVKRAGARAFDKLEAALGL